MQFTKFLLLSLTLINTMQFASAADLVWLLVSSGELECYAYAAKDNGYLPLNEPECINTPLPVKYVLIPDKTGEDFCYAIYTGDNKTFLYKGNNVNDSFCANGVITPVVEEPSTAVMIDPAKTAFAWLKNPEGELDCFTYSFEDKKYSPLDNEACANTPRPERFVLIKEKNKEELCYAKYAVDDTLLHKGKSVNDTYCANASEPQLISSLQEAAATKGGKKSEAKKNDSDKNISPKLNAGSYSVKSKKKTTGATKG